MKQLLAPLCALAIISLAGCKTGGTVNPLVGPAIARALIADAAGYAIQSNPNAIPGVQAGAALVCSFAEHTNVNPAALVGALNAYGLTNDAAVWILRAAVQSYEIYHLAVGGSTNSLAAQPYLDAACGGLNDALAWNAGSPLLARQRRTFPPVPRSLFPQIYFPKH